MKAITEPRGKAREYAWLACNPFYGQCPFQCSYCYVAKAMRQTAEAWVKVPFLPREGFLAQLRRDASRYEGENRRVHLAFTGDVYCPEAIQSGITRQVLEILHEHNIAFQVLTKGGTAACRDFDLYGQRDAFAATLTCNNPEMETRYEPRAAPWCERTLALQVAHERGIETWVSIEPVLDAAMSLGLMRVAAPYTDLFKIGTLNHAKSNVDYREFGRRAIRLCDDLGKPYFIKDSLARYLKHYCNTDNRCAGWKRR